MQLALDPNVYVIVTLRRREIAEDVISVVKSIMEEVDKETQAKIARLIALEDEEVVNALVKQLPAVRESLVRKEGKTPAEIIEDVAKLFTDAV